ncbi:MAG: anti-sigma factor antagonist [Verrucomicrobia bacterium]|nr:MAG: anti-sigma factor antagonist [Verrucomicrobiota bacterium]
MKRGFGREGRGFVLHRDEAMPIRQMMSHLLSSILSNDLLKITLTLPRLDARVVADFKAAVEEAWSPEVKRVEIDFATVEFLDSSGVGALLSIYKRLPAPAQVRLVNLQPGVQTVIEMLRLHRVFELQAA